MLIYGDLCICLSVSLYAHYGDLCICLCLRLCCRHSAGSPFNANPIIPVVIGPVLTICLPVSIYAHIWRYPYLSVCIHFMPIYGDLCRHSAGSGKPWCQTSESEPFVLVPENRVSDRVEAGYCTTWCGGERACRIWNREWMPHPLMQTPLYLFICVHFLCPFYAHMPIYGDLCICLCPFYAYYTLAQMPRSLYLPIYRDLCIGLCPFYAHIRRYLSGRGKWEQVRAFVTHPLLYLQSAPEFPSPIPLYYLSLAWEGTAQAYPHYSPGSLKGTAR